MKYLFLSLLIGCTTLSGMNSTQNRQALVEGETLSEVRRSMRAMYMRAFCEDNAASREAYNVINMLSVTCPLVTGLSNGALSILQHYKFIDENNKFDLDRIDAWNKLKSLGVDGKEYDEKEDK